MGFACTQVDAGDVVERFGISKTLKTITKDTENAILMNQLFRVMTIQKLLQDPLRKYFQKDIYTNTCCQH